MMMMGTLSWRWRRYAWAGLVILLGCLGSGGWAHAASPMAMLKKSNEEVRQTLRQQKSGTAATKEQKERIKKIVNGFLDYEGLARRSLAANWDKVSVAQR